MGPQSLTNLFTYKNDMTSYNLRNISNSSTLCLLILLMPTSNPNPQTGMLCKQYCTIPYSQKFENRIKDVFRNKIATYFYQYS